MREMDHVKLSPDDMYSVVLSMYVSHVTLKWKRPAGIQGMDEDFRPSQITTDESEESVESQRDCKDQVKPDVRNLRRRLISCKINDDMEANEATQKLCSDSTKGNIQCNVNDGMEVDEVAEKTHINGTGEDNNEARYM